MRTAKNLFKLFCQLSERDRVALLKEAAISDDRPDYLRDQTGDSKEGRIWIDDHRAEISAAILRYANADDSTVSGLAGDGDLAVPREKGSPQSIVLEGWPSSTSSEKKEHSPEFCLPELAATTTLFLQILIDLNNANRAFGLDLPAPGLRLSHGSIQLTVGGGLFASGVSLLVACAAGLIGAPIAAGAGGAALLLAGAAELAVGWRRASEETFKVRAERQLAEVNVELKRLELEKALCERTTEVARRPESAELSRETIQEAAKRLQLTEAYATHLLNRALPNFLIIRQQLAGVQIRVVQGKV